MCFLLTTCVRENAGKQKARGNEQNQIMKMNWKQEKYHNIVMFYFFLNTVGKYYVEFLVTAIIPL